MTKTSSLVSCSCRSVDHDRYTRRSYSEDLLVESCTRITMNTTEREDSVVTARTVGEQFSPLYQQCLR